MKSGMIKWRQPSDVKGGVCLLLLNFLKSLTSVTSFYSYRKKITYITLQKKKERERERIEREGGRERER